MFGIITRRSFLEGSIASMAALALPLPMLFESAIPRGLGAGIPWQHSALVGEQWYKVATDALQPKWWLNWRNDRVGDTGYVGMAFRGEGDGYLKLNEPELPTDRGGCDTSPEEAAKMSHDWIRPWSGPGVCVGYSCNYTLAFEWLDEYLKAGGALPDVWNIHIYGPSGYLISTASNFSRWAYVKTGEMLPVMASEVGDPEVPESIVTAADNAIRRRYLTAAAVFSAHYEPLKQLNLLTSDGELTMVGKAFVNVQNPINLPLVMA